ncbi:hypothetical protein AX16_008013 [Volvariella volvacea WC 439]|nr:hypothetical protein AX16_008013 [Volvariella volvacea WC 439]
MLTLVIMSALLGLAAFGCGILPLSFTFSKQNLEHLSHVGTGLLLGAALGIIIPEGIESAADANPGHLPISQIALSLLVGFTFMLVVEQLLSPHAHSHTHGHGLSLHNAKDLDSPIVEFDAELGELSQQQRNGNASSAGQPSYSPVPNEDASAHEASKAFPLTLGLVVHGLADGLALGVSSLMSSESTHENPAANMSFIVFLALIIHKAPTALALTTSLMASSLPRADCKKHLAAFSASTPIGAIASYLVFSFLGGGDGEWAGVALLISGGSFLYVATVLQPVSHSNGSAKASIRVACIVTGMFIPFILGSIFGHGH